MTSTVVDTNVFIDLLGPETEQRRWSLRALQASSEQGRLILSPIVWAELAASPLSERQLLDSLSWLNVLREQFSFAAAVLAGRAHRAYRRAGGAREWTLPDFLIGAQACAGGHLLLTRDAARYRSYFPSLDIISPETHP